MVKKLEKKAFLNVVKNAPLVSIDLIVRNAQQQVLLGYRKNEPARDSWFVPGGRILKDESISAAFKRIVQFELNIDMEYSPRYFFGFFEHLYQTNLFEDKNFGTHYIVLAHTFKADSPILLQEDAQHERLRWFDVDEIQKSHEVHTYTKNYFYDL